MKRFTFWFLVSVAAFAWVKSRHAGEHREWVAHVPPARVHRVEAPNVAPGSVVFAVEGRDGQVFTRQELDRKFGDHTVFAGDEGGDRVRTVREPVEGLPVPVVPGSEVSTALIEPPAPPAPPAPPRLSVRQRRSRRAPVPAAAVPAPEPLVAIAGRLSATPERARADARRALETELADRLSPDVPRSWKVPARLVDSTVRGVKIKPVERDYGTVYEATLTTDLSPRKRSEIASAYHDEQVTERLGVLGGILAFVLACLAAISGYIRADEATKGYYTNRLRLAAAAGVGAAGLAVYRMFA